MFDAGDGLPARGNDIDLIRHAEPPPARTEESAFRGTVNFPISPARNVGACFWAGADGFMKSRATLVMILINCWRAGFPMDEAAFVVR